MFRMLLAADGSNFAMEAADMAGELCRKIGSDAQITVLNVIEPPPMPLVAGPMEVGVPLSWPQPEEQARAAQRILDATQERLRAKGQTGVTRIAKGKAADVLCDIASKENFDLIVLGCRGMGHLTGMLLGSVSDKVLHRATVPVLIVRRPPATTKGSPAA